MRKTIGYGWRPDLPGRDPAFAAAGQVIPDRLDWWQRAPKVPAICNQGRLGACVGNGLARRIEFLQGQLARPMNRPSRLQIYYDARAREGTTDQDCGCQIRDAILSAIVQGVCSEDDWPYDEAMFARRAPASCYAKAAGQEVIEYRRVDNTSLTDLLTALTIGPVVFGLTVYDSFESRSVARTGIVPIPGSDESEAGGHCMLLTGFDAPGLWAWADNSWGPGWGLAGRCKIPLAYLTDGDLADDFWLVTKLSPTAAPHVQRAD